MAPNPRTIPKPCFIEMDSFKKVIANKAEPVSSAIIQNLTDIDTAFRKSITYDNGKENVKHQDVNQALGISSYFCNAYRSWEKGSVEQIIGLIRTITTKPLSIDSLNPNEIIEATKAGIDMIISVYEGNIDEIYRYVANKACILIPRDKSGRVPEDPMDRINLLEHLLF